MQYLHNHDIVHGDLAPGNVLLAESTKDSRRWECKVSDFGLAQIGDASNRDLPSSGVGTGACGAASLGGLGTLTLPAACLC